jgi:hypothetical protein
MDGKLRRRARNEREPGTRRQRKVDRAHANGPRPRDRLELQLGRRLTPHDERPYDGGTLPEGLVHAHVLSPAAGREKTLVDLGRPLASPIRTTNRARLAARAPLG